MHTLCQHLVHTYVVLVVHNNGMPRPLTPETRRQIIEFDPTAPGAPSIQEFCLRLKISRRSFYNIRDRYSQESEAALHPHSSAPKTPHRTYDPTLTATLLSIRARLKKAGWDYGPISIYYEGTTAGELQPPVPSVSTIARMLRAAGAVESNPKKRPKTSMVRFQRGQAMQLWQIDAFIYKLHNTNQTPVTIYQLIDDATRFDVGTCVFPNRENSRDALAAVKQAINNHGVPHELLSDNGLAFNQLRRGLVGPLESYLASQGCFSITGAPGHRQTQGKDERSHRTLLRFLDAHQPATIAAVEELITRYREHYNHQRPHQALPGHVTPATAWDMVGAVKPRGPVDPAVLTAKAQGYSLRRKRQAELLPMVRQEESTSYRHGSAEAGVEGSRGDLVIVTRSNQVVFFQGMRIAVPLSMRGRMFYRMVLEDEFCLFCAVDGELELRIPLPVVAIAATKSYINSYNIQGVWLRNPTNNWRVKHARAIERFKSIGPEELL